METVVQRFKRVLGGVDHWSLRLVEERVQRIAVRQGTVEPIENQWSTGAHITVVQGKGVGYAATSDLSRAGLAQALRRAVDWAKATASLSLLSPDNLARPQRSGSYRSPVGRTWDSMPLTVKLGLLRQAATRLKRNEAIVDWRASLYFRATQAILVTPQCEIEQQFEFLIPGLEAVANRAVETQRRSFGYDNGVQAGLEYLDEIAFCEQAERVGQEALELLHAPNCPSGTLDLLLLPEQMMLQIHESIGHPLELDRILGDERNYAGTSFVTLDMFGHYRYGSELLNVSFDPSNRHQLASYEFDEEGTPAERELVIKQGILLRPLGGATSQRRTGMAGVANARACQWNRPAIDRMANLNLEPGESSMANLIQGIERGVLMDTNRSWSIDDSRNKFQFGCEYARLIEDGELKSVVRNPNYRGISANFWRSLSAVGDASTVKCMGTPTCGKGEPNQAIHVGHASPACVFANVDVFGSAE
ncbi:MAG: TldD/PmbA family protein [Gammaproteobacteria bacterium]